MIEEESQTLGMWVGTSPHVSVRKNTQDSGNKEVNRAKGKDKMNVLCEHVTFQDSIFFPLVSPIQESARNIPEWKR